MTKYLKNLREGDKFVSNGKTYVVQQHDGNMTEVWSKADRRYFAWWIWTVVA